MKFYTNHNAPSPNRVNQMLKAKGVELDAQIVDLRSGEHMQPAYAAINPRCTVPALVLGDGSCLTEVVGICAYLDALYPDKPMMGVTAEERAKVLNWMHRIFTDMTMAIAEVLRNSSPAMKDRALPGPHNFAQIPELVERGRARFPIFVADLDQHLQNNAYITGDTLRQPDIDAYVALQFAGWVKFVPDDSLQALAAWQQKVAAAVA